MIARWSNYPVSQRALAVSRFCSLPITAHSRFDEPFTYTTFPVAPDGAGMRIVTFTSSLSRLGVASTY